jgi:hypothetical protein
MLRWNPTPLLKSDTHRFSAYYPGSVIPLGDHFTQGGSFRGHGNFQRKHFYCRGGCMEPKPFYRA